jgi:hypothetical protein
MLALMTDQKRIACQVMAATGLIMASILAGVGRRGHGAKAPIFRHT